jgi:Zn-dependent protease with chaperone function
LLFVVGHEFGHVAYGHHLLPTRAILAQKGACDAERALKSMACSHRAEISADRVGLLCCQDPDVAATAFVKLPSGLSEQLVDFDLQGYVSQVADLEEVSRTVRVLEDFYSADSISLGCHQRVRIHTMSFPRLLMNPRTVKRSGG